MRNKLTKFLTSECPPKGMRQFTKTWKYAACMLLAFILGIGQMWAADITVTPPTPNNASNPYSTGLYVMSISSTAASSGAKLSSGAITTGTNGDVITIHFEATKSDMYIKTITFNSLSNGTLSSDDGTFEGQVFSATGNKNSVNVVLTSNSSKKGTVKVTNVVVNTGTNDVEVITFTGASGKNATFTSSATTSALSSISTDNSSCSVSSGKLSWANGKKIILTSGSNIKYVAFSISDGKMYGNKFSATEDTYNNANYTWSGSSKTVTLTNGTGGGREIQSLYVIIEAATKHTVTINPNGGSYASTPDGWTESAGVYTKSIEEGTSFTAPAGLAKGTDDLTWKDGSDNDVTFPVSITGDITFVAQWAPHAVSDDATLKSLTVNGDAVAGFDPATIVYNVELPFGTVAVPTVAGAANDANAKSVVVTPAASLPGSTTVVVTAEDNSTKTYTINFTVSTSKLIDLVWATGQSACEGAGSQATVIKSNDAKVSSYIKAITFENAEGSGDNAAEGGSLNTGKKAGNIIIIQTQPGYLFTTMSFCGKIQDSKCEISVDGGASWTDLNSTNTSGNATYCNVVSAASTNDIRIKGTGASGTWIRNMQLTVTTGCAPVAVSWTSEPAAEYELGKAATAIAAAANSGATITYASDATGVIEVATDGALTLKALGTANLSASAPAGDGSLYCDASGDQISKSVKTYYLVTFDPQNGEATSSTKYYAGDAAIALPSAPSWPGHTFQGWFDAASAGTQVTSAVTPEASRTIYAQWTLDCAGATINTQPVGANYLIGRTATALNCEATAGNGGALTYTWYSCDDALGTNPVALAGAPTPSTAAAATFYYYCTVIEEGCATIATSDIVTVNVAPKDGVSIIKVATTGGSNKTVTGLYAGEGDVNLSDSKKMDGGKYIGFTLDGTTLQAGDRINVHTTTASTSGGSHIIFYDNMTDKNELYDTEEIGGVGNNIFTINAAMVGNATAYVYRSDADAVHKWNGFIDYIEVTRAINPILTAITINGRDGEIDALDDHHFTVTIPSDANLASLTIVPTIVSNTAEADVVKTVESNGGAWVLTADGDNTYRIKDKDGDYTDYTITLIRDVLKYTVTFDTDGGNSIDAVEVVADGYLTAGQVPADPTKEDYIFQYWSLGGSEVADLTAVQIDEPKTFVAVWAADGAIKLLDGATVNHTNFITGVTADETVEFMGNTVNYAKFAGTCGNVNNVKDLTKSIIYNATTNKTKIQISAHNNSTSGRNIYVIGLVEGASEAVELANISLGNKEDKVSDWIEFDNAANRTIYIMVPSSAGDVYFTQVKVIESGETPMKQAGETGYSLNFNKGRFFGIKDNIIAFEGLNVGIASSDCQPLNTSIVKLNNTSMSFTVASAMTLSVTTNNNKTYYVTEGAAGTDNETAKTGVSEFNLTAGTWYITAGASNVEITNIAFSAPKCEQPTVVDMENIGLCEGNAFTALTVSASVTDGGTLHYQWYKHPTAGDDEAVGTDASSYTPEADGQYYVVVTNQLADHSDNSKASNTVAVEHFASAAITTAPANQRKEAGQNATLTVAATGKAPLTYQWYTCDENGDNAVLIDGAEAETYQVEVTAAMHQYYKVVVGSGCGSAEAVALVEEWHEVTPANVTGSRTWDWAAESMGEIATESGSFEYLMANVSSQIPNTEAFRSDMLYITANYANRSSSNKFFQGWQIRFYTEVPGKVSLNCRAIHGTMSITINGTVIDDAKGSDMGTATTPFFVPAGWVTIVFDNQSSGYEGEAARVQKIVFNATPDYTRTEMLGNGVYGTICVDHNVPEGGVRGVTVYEIAGREPQYGKIAFDEVTEMEAGVPYVFIAHGNEMALYYGETKVDNPVDKHNGMYGTFTAQTLTDLDGIYYFAKSALWSCVDLTSLNLPANRAYVKLSEIDYLSDPNPAPGRKRILLGVNGQNAATDLGNVQGDEVQSTKVLINGQLFILRGEKMYDATGRMVK